jgi:hypothetical protein
MKTQIMNCKRDCLETVSQELVLLVYVLTVERACTDPNQIAMSSWTIRLGVQGFCRGEVSIIH